MKPAIYQAASCDIVVEHFILDNEWENAKEWVPLETNVPFNLLYLVHNKEHWCYFSAEEVKICGWVYNPLFSLVIS